MRSLLTILLLATVCLAQGNKTVKPPMGTQINWSHPLARGLVGCWLMNEGTGNRVNDLSGNGNSVTCQGNAQFIGGRFGPCLLFDGTDDYLDCGTAPILGGATSATWSLWVYRTGALENRGLIAKYTTATNQRVFAFGATPEEEISGYLSTNGTAGVAFTSTDDAGLLVDNVWYNLVWVWNGAAIYFYRDGRFISSVATTVTTLYSGSSSLSIGTTFNLGNPWIGSLDDVQIWRRALTASEVAQLYQDPFAIFEQERPELYVQEQETTGAQVIIIASTWPIALIFVLSVAFSSCRRPE